jgi:hypothetical protein
MEKHGDIAPDHTPVLSEQPVDIKEKCAEVEIEKLDRDFRKAAADSVASNLG